MGPDLDPRAAAGAIAGAIHRSMEPGDVGFHHIQVYHQGRSIEFLHGGSHGLENRTFHRSHLGFQLECQDAIGHAIG